MRPYNHGALGRIMERVWRPKKGMQFKKIGENITLFEFCHKRDYEKVLAGRPWTFDRNLLVVQEFKDTIRLLDICFNRTPFWIRVLDLPMSMLKQSIRKETSDILGGCIQVDPDGRGNAKGSYLRIFVMLYISLSQYNTYINHF